MPVVATVEQKTAAVPSPPPFKPAFVAASKPEVPAAGRVNVAPAPESAPTAVVAFRNWANDYFQAAPVQREAMIGLNRGHGLQIDQEHRLHIKLGGCLGKMCHQWNRNNNL